MADPVFGRTNQTFPCVWLSLHAPAFGVGGNGIGPLVDAARASGLPLDISRAPALWGGSLGNRPDSVLMQVSNSDLDRAVDSRHAADLVQAHLIETLSSIGREYIDFYFLRSRRAWEESQISGALEALEGARQEGHVRFLGLYCDGPPSATIANWQFHDAFEVVSTPQQMASEDHEVFEPLARSRRVGMLHRLESAEQLPSGKDETVLLPVSRASEVERLGVLV